MYGESGDPGLTGHAAEQWGFITSAQAFRLGVNHQQIARLHVQGILERVRHGVYRVRGVPEHPADECRSEWLAMDPTSFAFERVKADHPTAVVSHKSAAVLHNLGDLDAEYIEFTTAYRRRMKNESLKLHQVPLSRDQWEYVDGLPVTTVMHTLTQLARAHIDGGHLASAVRDALITHSLDLDSLAATLAPHAKFYGAPPGNGKMLIKIFLDSAGIPEALGQTTNLFNTLGSQPPRSKKSDLNSPKAALATPLLRLKQAKIGYPADTFGLTPGCDALFRALGLDRLTPGARTDLLTSARQTINNSAGSRVELADVKHAVDQALATRHRRQSRRPPRTSE